MLKKINPILVLVTVVALALGLAATNKKVAAQEGSQNPNTPVSSTGESVAMVESNALSSGPARGTGKLSPMSEQQTDGAELQYGPVQSAKPESVIGADGRIRVTPTTSYPSRAIAWLVVTWKDNSVGTCSGWFIGVRTVATAGHCVWNTAAGAGHGWAKSIVVYPGRNGAVSPYGSTTAHRYFSVTGWTVSGSSNYDYGAIQTNIAKGATVGYFGFRWQASNVFGGSYTVRGYPGDKASGTMWTMSGAITHANTFRLWYSMDTFGGQSGSPLYHIYNATCCYGVGVHTYGTSVAPFFGNSATRITQSVFNNFVNWKAYPYP